MNGEMPTNFNPKIWWLEVGLNDLGRMQCSEEVVVLGVLRIVEEILAKKPDATQIVINSLFPLADLRGNMNVGAKDYEDSFNKDLRQKSTKKIEKDKLKELKKQVGKKKAKTELTGKTSHGDSAGVQAEVLTNLDKKKKEREKQEKKDKKQDKKQDKKKKKKDKEEGKKTRVLTVNAHESSRELGIFKKKDDAKEIRMKARKDKQKKFNPITHKERKLPLWTAITAVNAQLKKFASKQDRVTFFDSTDIFTDREDSNNYILRTDLVSVRGHPTRKGFEKWEKAIIAKAQGLLTPVNLEPAPSQSPVEKPEPTD